MNIFTHTNQGTVEERGDEAESTLYAGINLINEILSSVLGPKGTYKLMDSGKNISITNDGATILKNLIVDNPAAQILIDASVSQDWEEGDGTTSVGVLATEILKELKKLKIPKIVLIRGLDLALERALTKLEDLAFKTNADELENEMINLAKTTLCSKLVKCDLSHFSHICVQAILNLEGENDLNLIQIIKSSGNLEESYLADGFILDKDIEIQTISNAKVLIANTSLDTDKVKLYGAKINVNSVKELSEIESEEKEKMKRKIDKITSINFNVFVNRQILYDYPLELFKQKNISVIEQADFDGVERLNKLLGGTIVSSFENLNESALAECKLIKNVFIGTERKVLFLGDKKAVTIVVKGSSTQVLEEAERAIHDALCVLLKFKEEKRFLYGGGATEMQLALDLQEFSFSVAGLEAEAISAFSTALQAIPTILASNGGLDAILIKNKLRSLHKNNGTTFGVDFILNNTGCMKERKVLESFRTKRRVLQAAIEVAKMLIKVDGFVKCAPRQRTRE